MWQITKMLVDARRSDLIRAAERERAVRSARSAPRRREADGAGGPGHGLPPALGHPRGALREPARHRARQHHPQRRPADAVPRPARRPQPAAVDRRRLHAGVRRPAAHRRQPRRPLRPQAGRWPSAWRSSASVRCCAAFVGSAGAADRRPGAHGHRRRADHAGHAVDPHQHLPDPEERAKAIGIWAGVSGARHRPRPRRRRLAARALLVGLGVPRQRADRRRRARRRLLLRARVAGPDAAPRSTSVGALLSIVGLVALLWAIIEAPTRLDVAARASLGASRSAAVLLAASSCGSCAPTHPMLDLRFFAQPALQRRQPSPSRWSSSPCSARSSSSPSTCSSCSATRPLEAGVRPAARWPRDGRRRTARPAGPAARRQGGRRRRPGAGQRRRCCCSRPRRVDYRLRPRRASSCASSALGMGLAMAPGHRVDHGLAAAGQGRASARP